MITSSVSERTGEEEEKGKKKGQRMGGREKEGGKEGHSRQA